MNMKDMTIFFCLISDVYQVIEFYVGWTQEIPVILTGVRGQCSLSLHSCWHVFENSRLAVSPLCPLDMCHTLSLVQGAASPARENQGDVTDTQKTLRRHLINEKIILPFKS